jgi:penicillin-binding protein 2
MFKFRVRVVLIIIFGGFLMVSTRLFYLQVVRGDEYREYVKNVRLDRRVTEAARGRIYARRGELLAFDAPSFNLALVPSRLPERRAIYRPVLKLYDLGRSERLLGVRDVTVAVEGGGTAPYEVRFGLAATFLRREGPNAVEREENGTALVTIPSELRNLLETLAVVAETPAEEMLRELFQGLALVGRRWRRLRSPIVVARDVGFLAAAEIESNRERYPGAGIVAAPRRSYPYEHLAGHVLGYMQNVSAAEYDRWHESYAGIPAKRFFPDDTIGRSGIERSLDPVLRASRGETTLEVDAARHTQKVIEVEPPIPGAHVHLTLDMTLQAAGHEALEGHAGSLVFMEPDGRVLAMASSPGYNPNDLPDDRPDPSNPLRPMLNRAIQGAYPLGSAFKLLLAVAALEEGRAFREVLCNGRYHGSECHNHRVPMVINLHDAIKRSCNVYFYRTGQEMLGIKRLVKWARRFGFGQPTGIRLPGENDGLLPTPEWKKERHGERWYPGDTRNLAIGQGFLLVTPLQVARYVAGIANGGRRVRPRLVQRVEPHGGGESLGSNEESQPQDLGITPYHLNQVRRAMRGVCHERGGTARRAWSGWIEEMGYAVAGKTSTAVCWLRGEKSHVGWFVGFAPFHDPRVVFAVALEHEGPEGLELHGGDVAAPVARRVLMALPEDYLEGIDGRDLRVAARARAARRAAQAALSEPLPLPPEVEP